VARGGHTDTRAPHTLRWPGQRGGGRRGVCVFPQRDRRTGSQYTGGHRALSPHSRLQCIHNILITVMCKQTRVEGWSKVRAVSYGFRNETQRCTCSGVIGCGVVYFFKFGTRVSPHVGDRTGRTPRQIWDRSLDVSHSVCLNSHECADRKLIRCIACIHTPVEAGRVACTHVRRRSRGQT
jgi:hypothetical protein